MLLESFRVHNFRRLKDVSIAVDPSTTICVGANNSGKTSAAHVLHLMVNGNGKKLVVHDFNVACWEMFANANEATTELPVMELDLWFAIDPSDLHRVFPLLPTLEWTGTSVGIRIAYEPVDVSNTLAAFQERRAAAPEDPSSTDLFAFLASGMSGHYRVQYSAVYREGDNVIARPLVGDESEAKKFLDSLIRIDFLDAQRFQADRGGESGARELSKSLNGFYKRNLAAFKLDGVVMGAIRQSEQNFTEHLQGVFRSTLQQLEQLGYPGLDNPELTVRSAFDAGSVMAQNTTIEYALRRADDALPALWLPEAYNGLGFKNLIYMVIHILDAHQRWRDTEDRRPVVHLLVIEEPEVHLHAQLQQVFVRKILDIVHEDEESTLCTQMLISTHSPHIVNESAFEPVRYFRRMTADSGRHETEVLDLSRIDKLGADSGFLRRYLKLTHCDLFFADAVILVEGNVERLLMRTMIDKVAPGLATKYLSILEVGGAFAHKFKPLVSFLGIPTLVITDLDSVALPEQASVERTDRTVAAVVESPDVKKNALRRQACRADRVDATTSNETLKTWHPKLTTIQDLLAVNLDGRMCPPAQEHGAPVFIAYQRTTSTSYRDDEANLTGRTLEEAFAFENLEWAMADAQKELRLRPTGKGFDIDDFGALPDRIHEHIKSSTFKKTDFALALMMSETGWTVPSYIAEGLTWLEKLIVEDPTATDVPTPL